MAELTGDEPDLKSGDTGEGVVLLQVRLFGLGLYREMPDGMFNMVTENAVRELQASRGQDNTGQVTRETWEAILYLEQQAAIQYRYLSPYDALAQIVYDVAHPEQGGPYSQFSPYGSAAAAGYDQEAVDAGQYAQYAGQLSEDGLWRWDGYSWHSADGGSDAYPSDDGAVAQADEHIGRLSDDGRWRWDGADWQPVDGAGQGTSNSYVGQLSPDGLWRWDGSQWQAA